MTMENANTNISVWWDVGNCQIPKNFHSIDCIVNNIRLSLLKANLRGKLSISAYGNTNLIASGLQHALSTAGISPYVTSPVEVFTYSFIINHVL